MSRSGSIIRSCFSIQVKRRYRKFRGGKIRLKHHYSNNILTDKQNVLGTEISFTTIIEQLRAKNLQLADELYKSGAQATQSTRMKDIAEEEVVRLASKVEAHEMDKRNLHKEVEVLTGIVEFLRNAIVRSANDFVSKLKIELENSKSLRRPTT